MSEDDQITLIVASEHCDFEIWDLARVLGDLPDHLELRYFPDQIWEVLLHHRCPVHPTLSGHTKLWGTWSNDWVSCTGKERIEQKSRLEARMAIVEQRLQESERREVAAGKLRKSTMKDEQRYRQEDAATFKKEKLVHAMPMDEESYQQAAEACERNILKGKEDRAEQGENGKKHWLLRKMGKWIKAEKTTAQGSSSIFEGSISGGSSDNDDDSDEGTLYEG